MKQFLHWYFVKRIKRNGKEMFCFIEGKTYMTWMFYTFFKHIFVKALPSIDTFIEY